MTSSLARATRGRVLTISYTNARHDRHNHKSSSNASHCEVVSPHTLNNDDFSGFFYTSGKPDRIRPTSASTTFLKTVHRVEDSTPSPQNRPASAAVRPSSASPRKRPSTTQSVRSRPHSAQLDQTNSSKTKSTKSPAGSIKTATCLIGQPPSLLHRPRTSPFSPVRTSSTSPARPPSRTPEMKLPQSRFPDHQQTEAIASPLGYR
ncbi:hypothetical protein P9112_011422 [Eukaryota sp. TZLM1-RC]